MAPEFVHKTHQYMQLQCPFRSTQPFILTRATLALLHLKLLGVAVGNNHNPGTESDLSAFQVQALYCNTHKVCKLRY